MTKDSVERILPFNDLMLSCGVEPIHSCDATWSCFHDEVSEKDMKLISKRIKQLVMSIYIAGIQSAFESTVGHLHDEVIGIVLLSHIDSKGSKRFYVDKTRADAAVALLQKEIISRNEKVVNQIMLEFAGDDVYELLCDFSKRHGRDIDKQGPPCACSFARCLTCFEILVKSTVRLPPDVETVTRDCECCTCSQATCKLVAKREKIILPDVGPSQSAKPSATAILAEAWTGLSGLFWKVKALLKPLEYPEVVRTMGRIKKANGILLWHTLIALKLDTSVGKKKGKAREEDSHCVSKESGKTEMKQSRADIDDFLFKAMEVKESSALVQAGNGSRIVLANACRTRGNDAFVRAHYAASLRYYSWAIEYDRNDAIFYLNRAAVYLQLGKYAEAEQDCTSSIRLDSTSSKAFYRRGLSRARQGKIGLAAKDFREVLFLQRNSEAKVYLEWKTVVEKNLKETITRSMSIPKEKVIADVRLPSQKEILAESRSQQQVKLIEKKTTKGIFKMKKEAIEAMTVEQVFQQVCFALAFSHILHRRTGVEVRIPLQRRRVRGVNSGRDKVNDRR